MRPADEVEKEQTAVLGADISAAELARWLIRVESKIDGVTSDHEQRLRRIERVMYTAVGLAAAGATSGVGALATSLAGA